MYVMIVPVDTHMEGATQVQSPPSLRLTFSEIFFFFFASRNWKLLILSSTRLHCCCLTAAVQNATSIPVQRKF
jgi:hypothetical protein